MTKFVHSGTSTRNRKVLRRLGWERAIKYASGYASRMTKTVELNARVSERQRI